MLNIKVGQQKYIRGLTYYEYINLHNWIRYNYGKATHCEGKNCSKIYKKFQWSLKKGKKYEKNIKNFSQLCKSCHSKLDITDKHREIARKLLTGQEYSWKGKIEQYDLMGKYIRTHKNIVEASKYIKRTPAVITRVLQGKQKTAGGFFFKRIPKAQQALDKDLTELGLK